MNPVKWGTKLFTYVQQQLFSCRFPAVWPNCVPCNLYKLACHIQLTLLASRFTVRSVFVWAFLHL